MCVQQTSVCMYARACLYVRARVYVCVCTYARACLYVRARVYVCVCSMRMCMCIGPKVCLSKGVGCIGMCVCVYVCAVRVCIRL